MSTTTTIDANEGSTFADNNPIPEFPTTTEPDTNWGMPLAPSPPLSAIGQPRPNDHASLHWTACYDDYCQAHRQMKDNNYYPRRGNDRRRRNHQQCDCPNAHPYKLAEVIRIRHLSPRKACADWQKGKRVCPDCRFLVNLDNHSQRCQTTAQRAPMADITPAPQAAPEPTEEIENPHTDGAAPTHATHQDEQIRLLGEIVTTIHQTVTQEARHNHGIQRLLAQTMRGQHEADQQQLQGFARTLAGIINEQQRLTQQLQTRQQPSRPVRIYRRPLAPNRPDLAGASVWTGDVLSRIWQDRLGVATGAALALATIWLYLVSAAAVVALRA